MSRIPLHDHVDGNSGGPLDQASVAAAIGGSEAVGGTTTIVEDAVNAPISASLSNPPTEAELETAIGSPPSGVAGESYVVVDSDTGLQYRVVSDGEAFVFMPLVQPETDLVTLRAAAGVFADLAGSHAAAAYDATSNKTFWAYLNAAGDVIADDGTTQTTLHSALSSGDSHASPTILIRSSDRKVIVIYCDHNDTHIYVRISSAAADISAFAAETDIGGTVGGTSFTYPMLMELSDAIYLFIRTAPGGAAHAGAIWSYSTSTDNGATWSARTEVLKDVTYGTYWLAQKTAADRADFVLVDRSPFDAAGGSAYHMSMVGGTFYTSDGTVISATKPFSFTATTQVWLSDGTQRASPIGSVVLGSDGYPRLAFIEFETVSPEDSKYIWASSNGSTWATSIVAAAGSGSQTASCILDPFDPNTVVGSQDVASVAQVFRWTTTDNGATWAPRQVTNSAKENALVHAVQDASSALRYLWCAKTSGWTRNDTVAADFMGAGFGPTAGGQLQRLVALAGTTLGTDPLGELVFRWDASVLYASPDYGTTWTAVGVPLTVKDEGTPLATAATSLDFVGAGVVASGATAAKTITISGAPSGTAGGDLAGTYPDPTLADAAKAALVPHDHVAEETHLSDGSTVTWTLDQAFEPGSVIAWNTTTLARLTVTETAPDQVTISAAGTTGDKLVFDYAASLS